MLLGLLVTLEGQYHPWGMAQVLRKGSISSLNSPEAILRWTTRPLKGSDLAGQLVGTVLVLRTGDQPVSNTTGNTDCGSIFHPYINPCGSPCQESSPRYALKGSSRGCPRRFSSHRHALSEERLHGPQASGGSQQSHLILEADDVPGLLGFLSWLVDCCAQPGKCLLAHTDRPLVPSLLGSQGRAGCLAIHHRLLLLALTTAARAFMKLTKPMVPALSHQKAEIFTYLNKRLIQAPD